VNDQLFDGRMRKIRQSSDVDETDGSYLPIGDLVPNRHDSSEEN